VDRCVSHPLWFEESCENGSSCLWSPISTRFRICGRTVSSRGTSYSCRSDACTHTARVFVWVPAIYDFQLHRHNAVHTSSTITVRMLRRSAIPVTTPFVDTRSTDPTVVMNARVESMIAPIVRPTSALNDRLLASDMISSTPARIDTIRGSRALIYAQRAA
jgi:hypothetical protein